MWVIGFALFVLGIIFVIVAPINRKKNARCSAQAQGTLVYIRTHRRSNGTYGHTYYYTYNVDGTEYSLKSVNCSKEAEKEGDPCTIWYDPKKPERAQPFHYESDKIYKWILILGIVLIPVGLILIMVGAAAQSMK